MELILRLSTGLHKRKALDNFVDAARISEGLSDHVWAGRNDMIHDARQPFTLEQNVHMLHNIRNISTNVMHCSAVYIYCPVTQTLQGHLAKVTNGMYQP